MTEDFEYYFETNKHTWNTKAAVHAKSNFYDIKSFVAGNSSLNIYELDALKNVQGKTLLHLQCHFGQDTLSWSRLGAKCTGVDISENAVLLGQKLNEDLNLNARFICCNVLDTSQFIDEQYDIVFTSYGTIGWLPDLNPWAKVIFERLKSGGVFYIVDFHPIAWMFDYSNGNKKMKYGYNQKEAIYDEYEGTYADESSKIISKEYGWNHGLGEIATALTDAGLHLEYLKEHDASPYNIFPGLIKQKNGLYATEDRLFPLIFELKVTKP